MNRSILLVLLLATLAVLCSRGNGLIDSTASGKSTTGSQNKAVDAPSNTRLSSYSVEGRKPNGNDEKVGCCCLLKDEGPPPTWDCSGRDKRQPGNRDAMY